MRGRASRRVAGSASAGITDTLASAVNLSVWALLRRLGISANTVASICKRVYAKLGVRSRAELANRLGALSRM